MAGAARRQSQQSLHPLDGHEVMKKPVPMKPRITPVEVSVQRPSSGRARRPTSSQGPSQQAEVQRPRITPDAESVQGPSSGRVRRPTSSQEQSQQAEVQRPSSTRRFGPNGWRAPRKESNDGAGEWRRKATDEAEDKDGDRCDDDDDDDDDDRNEEKSGDWRRKRMDKKEMKSAGREHKWRTGLTKDAAAATAATAAAAAAAAADQRRWPSAKKDLSSSEDEDESLRRSAAALLIRDKNQVHRKSSIDRRKFSRPSLDSSDSFDHLHKTNRQGLDDSGYVSSSSSLSSTPLDLPAATPTSSLRKSSALRSSQSLDDELSRRLEGIRLDKDLTKQNADLVNSIQECVQEHLDRHDNHSRWTKCNQGSYYEKVKIQAPNEYDCMLTCEIRCKKLYYPAAGVESKSFCILKPTSHMSRQEIQGRRDEDGGTFLSPKKFRNEFEKKIRKALEKFSQEKEDCIIKFRAHNGRSPAVTIDVLKAGKGKGKEAMDGEFQFSVDFVPAIRLMEWPKPAENWHLRRLPEVEERLKKLEEPNVSPCAVAKIHPSEFTKTSDDSRLWRISFSAVEKYLVLHADRSLSTTLTCRKDVLRVLKMDLVDLKQQQQQRRRTKAGTRAGTRASDDDDLGFSSFHLKTILLLLANDRRWTTNIFADLTSDDARWSKERLRERYVDALQMVVSSLEMEHIEHYFIEGENLLSLQEITKRDRRHIIEHFQRLCDKYS